MASEWVETTLGEASESVQTGPFGSQLHKADYVQEGIPSIMPVNIGDNRIVPADIARITEEDAERLSKYRVKEGDVIYSRRGDVERRSIIRADEDGWLCGTGCLRVRFDKSILNPEYASFQLGSPECREWIVRHAIGATMPNLNTSILSALPIVLPPLPEQKAIAHILGSLDDKIELNRRMNETLEGIAQALFKSWFTDFDPVLDNAILAGNPIPDEFAQRAEVRRAVLAQNQPSPNLSLGERDLGSSPLGRSGDEGLSDGIRQLFPDSFQTSELGPIPTGWEVKPLGDVSSILNGHAFKSEDYTDTGVFVLRTKNFDANGLSSRRADDVFLPEIFTKSHETYLSQPFDFHLVMVGASIGKTSLLLPHMLPALRNQNMWCFRPKENFGSRTFLNLSVQNKVKEVLSWASGSARSFFRKSDFKSHDILVPAEDILLAFEEMAGPMYLGVSNRSAESENLSKLRDTLLPKLISGELRIEDAEKMVGDGALK